MPSFWFFNKFYIDTDLVAEPPKIRESKRYLKFANSTTKIDIIIGDTLRTSGGRDIIIKCPATGYPTTKIMWKFMEEMIKNEENTVINNKDQTLILKNTNEWKSGLYTCFATNNAGVAMSVSNLKIVRKYARKIKYVCLSWIYLALNFSNGDYIWMGLLA